MPPLLRRSGAGRLSDPATAADGEGADSSARLPVTPRPAPLLVALLLAALLVVPAAARAAAPLPAGWPATLELGVRDEEHGAADLRARSRVGLRYHYLSGGVLTGHSWTSWAQGDGSFVTGFIEDSTAQGFLPVFSLYHLRESSPGNAMGEADGILANLRDPETMRAYWEDARTFFTRAGATGATVVLHIEPDVWGYLQRAGEVALARSFAARFAQLRDELAPKVLLAYHLSTWGTGEDPVFSDPSDARIDELAQSSADFFKATGAKADLVFAEYADRDAGYREVVDGDGGAGRWDDGDFDRQIRFLGRLSSAISRRVVLWQIPLGNAQQTNTDEHWTDNKVERLLSGARGAALRRRYADAGVIGLLFGAALPRMTTPLTDGGLFDRLANAYYAAGPLRLPGITKTPAAAARGRTTAPRMRIATTLSQRTYRRGTTVRAKVRVTSATRADVLVAVQLFAPGASRPTFQQPFRGQRFRGGLPRRYVVRYKLPHGARVGGWMVKVGVFDPDFKRLLVWRPAAGAFVVR